MFKYYDMYSDECVTIIGGDCNIDAITSSIASAKLNEFSLFLKSRNLCLTPLLQTRKGPLHTFRSNDYSKRTLLDYIRLVYD